MTVLEVRALGVAWAASAPILEDVSLVLTRKIYGLVGANGAGKTTLLSALAGQREPSEGQVLMRPRDATVAFCPQRVDELERDVAVLAEREDALAAELRGRLGVCSGLSRPALAAEEPSFFGGGDA